MFSWEDLLTSFVAGCYMPMVWRELKVRFSVSEEPNDAP